MTFLATTCHDKVDEVLNDTAIKTPGERSESQLRIDRCHAELLYIKRSILVATMNVDADKPLKVMEKEIMNKP